MPNACRRVLYHRLMILNSSKLYFFIKIKFKIIFFLFLDARFNKGLIENCQADINKHCKSEIIYSDDDNDDDDKGNNSR